MKKSKTLSIRSEEINNITVIYELIKPPKKCTEN